jgi:ABC-2 type transport system permease protein
MYFAFAASAFQTRLAYRTQVWARILGEFIEISAKVAIWVAVYAGLASVDGVSLPQMITYAIIGSSVTTAAAWEWYVRRIGAQIKSGDVAVFMLKPVRYPLMLFAGECGQTGFNLISIVLPAVIVASLFYGMMPPASAAHGVLFVAFWFLGFAILFFLATIAALLSFWLLTTFALEWMLQALLAILAGRVVPLWFFPEQAAAILKYLPFAWVAFHPAAVYVGEVEIGEALILLVIGLLWALALGALIALLWHRAARRLVVQGG